MVEPTSGRPGRKRKADVTGETKVETKEKKSRRSKKNDEQLTKAMSDEDDGNAMSDDDIEIMESVRANRQTSRPNQAIIEESAAGKLSLSPLQQHNDVLPIIQPTVQSTNQTITQSTSSASRQPSRGPSQRRSTRTSTVLSTTASDRFERARSKSRSRMETPVNNQSNNQSTNTYVDQSLFESVAPQTAPQTVQSNTVSSNVTSDNQVSSNVTSDNQTNNQSNHVEQPRASSELQTAYLDTRHLIPYKPSIKQSITTWRDVSELAAPMLGLTVLTVASHLLLGAANNEAVRDALYHYAPIPTSVKILLLTHDQFTRLINILRNYLVILPILLCWFFAMNFAFKETVKSLHQRAMNVSVKDSYYLSGEANANFSRWIFGMIHVLFCLIWWSYVPTHSDIPNVLDLHVVFEINALFWCQDVLANAVFRENSQSNRQLTFSMGMLWLSMFCMFGEKTLLPSLTPYATAIHSVALTFLLIANVIQSLYAARDFIEAHGEQLSGLKNVLRVVGIVYGLLSTLLIVPAVFSSTEHVLRWLPNMSIAKSIKSFIRESRGQFKDSIASVKKNVTDAVQSASANVKHTQAT